jgi:hypothetical protein
LRLKLSVAGFADTDHQSRSAFYDPQVSFCHDASLAHLTGTSVLQCVFFVLLFVAIGLFVRT